MTLTENSSKEFQETQGPQKYSHHHEIAVGTHFHAQNMGLKLSRYFYQLMEKPLATSKFGFLTIRRQSATRKYLLSYDQGDIPGLRNPKSINFNTNHSYHQRTSL